MTALATPMRPAVLSLVTVVFGVGRLATDVPACRIADRAGALLPETKHVEDHLAGAAVE